MQKTMNKLNILFMGSSRNGGLTFNFTNLAIALRKFGHNVIMVSEPKEEEKGLFRELARNQINCHTLHGLDNLSIKNTIRAAGTMEKIIDYHDVDVIHAQGIRHSLVAFLASKIFRCKKKIRVVVSIHTTSHGTLYENATLLVESFLLNICAHLAMPVAKSFANRLVNFGLCPDKVVTVHNGIDLELFDEIMRSNEYLSLLPADFRSSSSIVVGYFANMVPRKGHKYLIEAISEVSKEFPNIRLIITSNGPLRDKLKILSENLDIKRKVLFTGKVGYRSLYQLLKRIDIYAFPSLAELFPFAILEAMAAGKPIVATNVGGVSEAVIDGVNGHLIPPKEPISLAKAIINLINDSDKAKEMGKNSRMLVEEKFDLAKIVHDLTRCYELSLMRAGNI